MVSESEMADALHGKHYSLVDGHVKTRITDIRFGLDNMISPVAHWSIGDLVDIHELRQRGATWDEVSDWFGKHADTCQKVYIRNRPLIEKLAEQHPRPKEWNPYGTDKTALTLNGESPSVKSLVLMVSQITGVAVNDILSPRRAARIVIARQAVFYLACKYTTHALTDIGRFLNRDHSTVMHGRDKASSPGFAGQWIIEAGEAALKAAIEEKEKR